MYSAENAGSTPDHPFAKENTMKKPSKYDRMGTAVIKKDSGFLYLTEDVDPLLDQMAGHIQAAKDAQKATSAAKVDLAKAESNVTDRDHHRVVDGVSSILTEVSQPAKCLLGESRSVLWIKVL